MEISKKSYSEVLDILSYMEKKYREKIPKDMMDMFEQDCDKKYFFELMKDTSSFNEKKYSDEALAIIAYINLKYWCETNEEKRKYRDMYLKNN